MNSVDFLLRVEERRSEGMLAETIGNLFIQGRGGQLELYHTMRNPSKEVRQHDGKVIECSLDQRTRKWVFMRVRADKSHPNAAHTVAGVERSIQDNLTEKEVVEFVRQQAFRAPT